MSKLLIAPSHGVITQGYGRTAFAKPGVYPGSGIHNGYDYSAGFGSPVFAVYDGQVVYCGSNGAWGNMVVIRHNKLGIDTLYAHLSRFDCWNGQVVKKGQVIGREGSTGFSTGSHLHFSIFPIGQYNNWDSAYNPATWLNKDEPKPIKYVDDWSEKDNKIELNEPIATANNKLKYIFLGKDTRKPIMSYFKNGNRNKFKTFVKVKTGGKKSWTPGKNNWGLGSELGRVKYKKVISIIGEDGKEYTNFTTPQGKKIDFKKDNCFIVSHLDGRRQYTY